MAPRSAKAKKAADVKVTEQDAPKKGRGKGKNAAEIIPENDNVELLDDKDSIENLTTVSKRGKKAVNDDKNNDIAPPAKKGRKKKDIEPEEKEASNDENSAEEFTGQPDESDQNDENVESNGHIEEPQTSAKGRKRPAKKETVTEKPEPKSSRGRGKIAKQEVKEDNINKEEKEEKPKSSGRGRGRKPAKPEPEPEDRPVEEEEKKEKAAPKNRKKGPIKAIAEKAEEEEDEVAEQEEGKPDETEPKKKESKGKKGKKAATKEVSEDEDEVMPSSKKRRINKKDEKTIDEEDVPETKPAKSKRGQKKAEANTDTKRKAGDEKGDTKKKAQPKNKSVTDFEVLDFSNTSSNKAGKPWNFKISSWNVDGIRAWLSKGCLDYLNYEKPDILCLQEVKCSQDKLPSEVTSIPGYHAYWLASDTDGYAGVGIYTTKLAMNVSYGLENKELDQEGRIITAEYEQFYLVCTYVPNSGRKLVTMPKRLQWNMEFQRHVKELDEKKPVIICGDMNVSHNEIDLANPKTNRKNAGFTDEERKGMTDLLGEGFIDTFRHLYPDKKEAYTFWTYMSNARARNVGWRLDYFIVSERLLPALCDNVIRDGVYGSDHCPLTLFLHLSSADKPKE